MTEREPSAWTDRLLRWALLVYPAAFRERFGASMTEAFHDKLAEGDGRVAWRRVWHTLRILAELSISGARERLSPTYRVRASHVSPARGSTMDQVAQDLRFAVRALVRRPVFALVAIGTLALGIGASTAVFSVVNGVLLRPMPYAEPEELVMVWSWNTRAEPMRGWMSFQDLESVREAGIFHDIEGILGGSTTVTSLDRPERFGSARVSGGILGLFGVAPHAGRDLRREENSEDAPRVVVVSYTFWQDQLGGREDVVGSTLDLSEVSHEIVGVAPPGFDYPDGAQLWTPYRQSDGCGRNCHVYQGAVARLAEGLPPAAAEERLSGLASALEAEFPGTNTDKGLRIESLLDYRVGDFRNGLYVVLGAVGLLLLIACANLANLLLVRASTRGGEVALRSAVGASRGRLTGQILTESVVLALAGGVAGVLLSIGLLEAFRASAPLSIPRMETVAVDGSALLFALGATTLVALIFGLSPALHLVRRTTAAQLVGAGRGGVGRGEVRARSMLLAGEVALSLVLLGGAGLLTRSLGALYDVDLGFDGREVVRFDLGTPSARYSELEDVATFYAQLEERLSGLPGVERVGSIYGAPLGGGNIIGTVLVEGRPEPAPSDETAASVRPSTPGYADVLGLRVLRGRWFEPTDREGTEPVAVVNETFVAQNFPGEEVLGARIMVTATFGYRRVEYRTVVGVVRDVRPSLTGDVGAEMYVPHAQFGPNALTIHMKGRPGASNLIAQAREQVAQMDPVLLLRGEETIEQAIKDDAASTRFYLLLVGLFAGLAVILAAVGLYGVVAYLVARRTREIGIRIALGAGRPNITGMVLGQGLVPAAWGLALGLVVSLAGGRVMEGLLYEVEPSDPLVLVAVSGLILAVATAAILVPARRATRVDPTEALRSE